MKDLLNEVHLSRKVDCKNHFDAVYSLPHQMLPVICFETLDSGSIQRLKEPVQWGGRNSCLTL
jgi:hypothetical protein